MSIQDKIEVLKHALTVALKVTEIIVKIIDTILDKIGGNN